MKAVLIDDEYYALQGLKMRLDEIGGIDVAGMFTTGKQALENIETLRPDVVFLDIEMPNISGIELFSRILEIQGDVKIVFTTAYTQYAVEAAQAGKTSGARAFRRVWPSAPLWRSTAAIHLMWHIRLREQR